jgi:ribosome recycling factor
MQKYLFVVYVLNFIKIFKKQKPIKQSEKMFIKGYEEDLQKAIDTTNKQIDEAAKVKEEEVMKI